MNKIEKQLIPGEEIIYQAKVHWWIYKRGTIYLLLGLVSFYIAPKWTILSIILILQGVRFLIQEIITSCSTAYIITNQRVIFKYGGFRQYMVDVLLPKATMLRFSQGTVGRILNFGGVSVSVSGSKCSFPYMKDPMRFRQVLFNEIQQKI